MTARTNTGRDLAARLFIPEDDVGVKPRAKHPQ
jgi:hypothetical protein